MTTVFLTLAVLLLLAAIASYTMLQISVLRHPMPDLSDPKVLRHTKWHDWEPQITAGVKWLQSRRPEEMQVVSFDGKLLYGRFVPHENAKGTIVFFHGYRSSYVLDFAFALEFYYGQGFNLLICDQRAHNKSKGNCTTFGVKERHDVVSWTTYLSMLLGEDHPIYLAGLSMGASTVLMASNLEHSANLRGVIADCGFTSPKAIMTHVAKNKMHLPAKLLVPILGVLTRLFCGFALDECSTTDALAQTKLPILLIHGTADKFVPSYMSEENFAACRSEKQLLLVDGAVHALSYVTDRPRYEAAVQDFLLSHLPQKSAIPSG